MTSKNQVYPLATQAILDLRNSNLLSSTKSPLSRIKDVFLLLGYEDSIELRMTSTFDEIYSELELLLKTTLTEIVF